MARKADCNTVFCYAEGQPGRWEGYCLTFDLAVQGHSYDEVRQKLAEQISLYFQGVMALPVADQKRLLRRRAPLGVWIMAAHRTLGSAIRKGANERHEFRLPINSLPVSAPVRA